jgi:glycine cleavage system transcriptional repressor
MKKFIAVSAIGEDRPGIVAALTKVFFETGCNLENSSMTQLRGDFAVLLLISMPESLTLESLKNALQPIVQSLNLAVTYRELKPGEIGGPAVSTVLPYTLMVYGLDHPGIVYKVAQAVTELNINITDLRTHVTDNKGVTLYSLILDIEIPDAATLLSFRKDLETLKQELNVDMTLKAVETDEL